MHIKRIPATGAEAQAVVFGNTVFCGGISAEKDGTMAEQTADILAQYDRLFAALGVDKENIVMSNTFLFDMTDGDGYGQTWKKWLVSDHTPAGVCVQAALPPGKKIIISLIAAVE